MSETAIGSQDDQSLDNIALPAVLPILPISEAVIFPYMMVPLVLSDDNLIKLADECLAGDKILGAFAQRGQDHHGTDSKAHSGEQHDAAKALALQGQQGIAHQVKRAHGVSASVL